MQHGGEITVTEIEGTAHVEFLYSSTVQDPLPSRWCYPQGSHLTTSINKLKVILLQMCSQANLTWTIPH